MARRFKLIDDKKDLAVALKEATVGYEVSFDSSVSLLFEVNNTFSSEELMAAWEKMGQPTDAKSITTLLSKAGLKQGQVKDVLKSIGDALDQAKVELGSASDEIDRMKKGYSDEAGDEESKRAEQISQLKNDLIKYAKQDPNVLKTAYNLLKAEAQERIKRGER
jgi:hypothetical protein